MEIKQLEYFAAAVEYGSLNRAAEKLYTTQPNVSRVLNSLEKELHVTLLERSNKGIKMTPQGEELYGHAMSILKHSNVIRSMSERPNGRRFSVSGYRSGLLTKLMVQLYQGGREQIKNWNFINWHSEESAFMWGKTIPYMNGKPSAFLS